MTIMTSQQQMRHKTLQIYNITHKAQRAAKTCRASSKISRSPDTHNKKNEAQKTTNFSHHRHADIK